MGRAYTRRMLRAATGLSTRQDAAEAAREAITRARAGLGGAEPGAAVLAATAPHGGEVAALAAAAAEALPGAAVCGATVDGVMAGGREPADARCIGVLLLAGPEAATGLAEDVAGAEETAFAELARRVAPDPAPQDLVLLLAAGPALDPWRLVSAATEELGPATWTGATASEAPDGAARVFAGARSSQDGVAALRLRGGKAPALGVTQSCRLQERIHTVTRSEGHWVLGLDGRPALDVYREAAGGRLASELRRAVEFVLAARAHGGAAEPRPGAFLARRLAGVSARRRAFALPEPVARGSRLAFAVREPNAARDELAALLGEAVGLRPAAGLYLSGRDRGPGLFGVDELEAAYLGSRLPGVPLLGLRTGCELAPQAGAGAVLTHAGVLALLPAG